MPIAGIFVIIWIIRALANSGNSGSSAKSYHFGTSANPYNFGGSANSNQSTDVSGSLIVALLRTAVFVMVAIFAIDMEKTGLQHVLEVLAIPVLMPNLFVSRVIVPLGLPRLAYWYFRCLWPGGFAKLNKLGALYFYTLALARKGASAKSIAWARQRLTIDLSAHVAYDLTLATLLALEGENATARRMFQALDDLPVKKGLRRYRRIARDWLVMDAARRGDWQEVIARGRRGFDSLRWSYVVARIAERMDRHPQALANWQLWALCLYAPRRLKLLPLLRQALAIPWTEQDDDTATPFPKDLATALSNLASMLTQTAHTGKEPTREEFLSTIRWVNIRLESPQLHMQIQQRLQALGSLNQGGADAVVNSFREQLIALAKALIERSPHLVIGERERPVIKEAIDHLRQAAFRDIEVRCSDYAKRAKEQLSFNVEEEWKAWEKLSAIADRLLLIAPDTEDSLFREMYAPVCNFAVFQHNHYARRRLAHDMFFWLSKHAHSNPAAVELLEKNRGGPFMSTQQRLAAIWHFWKWKLAGVLGFVALLVLLNWLGSRPVTPAPAPTPQQIAQRQSGIPPEIYAQLKQVPAPQAIAPANPAQGAAPTPMAPDNQSNAFVLPQPKHGGQVLGTRWKNYEVAVQGQFVMVYRTDQDVNFDLIGATGEIAYRQMHPGTIRRFPLIPIDKDTMMAISDPAFKTGDKIWIHVYPKSWAESSMEVIAP